MASSPISASFSLAKTPRLRWKAFRLWTAASRSSPPSRLRTYWLFTAPGPSNSPCPCWPSIPPERDARPSSLATQRGNWQQVPRALDQESPFLRFWGQMVRWLANRTESVKTEAGISTQTDKAYYAPDAPITITAVVRDKEGEGTTRRAGLGPGQESARQRGNGTAFGRARIRRTLFRSLRAKAGRELRNSGRGRTGREDITRRADQHRCRPAQPGIRPARSRRENADRRSPRPRAGVTTTSAPPIA